MAYATYAAIASVVLLFASVFALWLDSKAWILFFIFAVLFAIDVYNRTGGTAK